jgi:predicted nucleotidyltransferase
VPELTDAVRTAVDGLPVVVVWLFGSTPRGTQRADSDIDLAVLPDPAIPADQRLGLHLALIERLGAAGVVRPDVVLVDQAPLRLQARVSAEGRVLLSRDEPARVAWTSRVFREHADFAVLQDELDRQMLRAHATGAR